MLPKSLDVGGSQINALDLAAAVGRAGHDVVVVAPPGLLSVRLEELGIEYLPVRRPIGGRRAGSELRRLIRERVPDIVHAYEVGPTMAAVRVARSVVIGSFYGPRVPWYLPESIPVVVGSPRLAAFTRRWRSAPVALIPPPVDLDTDDPERVTPTDLGAEGYHVVVVSRLVEAFKADGLRNAIDATAELVARGSQIRLTIVGDGPLRRSLQYRVERLGIEDRVIFAGERPDPRPWYAAASVVLGVGTAALRGAAFGKPTVILGRQGYARLLAPDSADELGEVGYFGVGDGAGSAALVEVLQRLEHDASLRDRVGRWARSHVAATVGLPAAAERLIELYQASVTRPPIGRGEVVRSMVRVGHYRIRRAMLRRKAARRGMAGDEADNWVHGRLRELALPPARFGTGRYRFVEDPRDHRGQIGT